METIVVRILGSDYSVRAGSGRDHVLRVASVVDSKMRELDRQFPQSSPTRTAVLACMNLVDEHLSEDRENRSRLQRRIRELIDKLDSVL